ncbi:MAG: DUF2142 domain-containing protein [Clostridia bacterium]|nr:DUF2142 domain-containing protein [Clostridia bacterium]
MKKLLNRRSLIRAAVLVVAALALAAGLEWVMQRTLPPIFTDAEVDISSDPTLIQRGVTYTHPSGRSALVEEWHRTRFIATFLLQLGILILFFPLGVGKKMGAAVKKSLSGLKQTLTAEKPRNLKLLLCFVLTFLAVYFIGRAWVMDVYHRDHWIARAVCLWSAAGAACLTTFRRTLGKKPEVFFLILTLIAGGLMAFFLPAATGVSLDDGYHYQHAMNYSTLGRVRFTQAEWDAMQEDNQKNYEMDQWASFHAAEDAKYAQGAVYVTGGFHLSIKEYWLAASGLGLFLGRALGLPFWVTWGLGRFFGLLAYALIGYVALRRLKSGKMIAAMVLMMPGSVFLAANYSYDPGVIVGITLSCCYWAAQWQEPKKILKNGDVAIMMAGMLIACYAKAIYFPLFLLFLFLPKSKFRGLKHRRAYTAVVLLSMVIVMLYILLPLGKSGGQGDTRAEGDVNTFGQIRFILTHPLQYAEYLWHFLREYLGAGGLDAMVTSYGYQGGGRNGTLILLLMVTAALTDYREEGTQPAAGVRVFGEILLFGALVLMITSMYVWFTAVGSPEFRGMQPRYMIPYVYPALALVGSGRMRNRRNPALHNGVLFAGMTFAIVSGFLYNCVEYYH